LVGFLFFFKVLINFIVPFDEVNLLTLLKF